MDAMDQPSGDALALPELVEARLAGDTKLSEPAKALIREALGASGTATGACAAEGPVYLGKVTVTGFRGVGSEARLNLRPKPGVTLVIGRNGSGKSSIAEAVETLFTGTNAHCSGQRPNRAVRWRNLHHGDRTVVEAKLAVDGDPSPSTLTRTWTGDTFADTQAVLKRPGQGTVPLEQAGWEQAMRSYRPFLSYVDLGTMLNGKPTEMYDNVAAILGLEYLNAAARRLADKKRELEAVQNAEKEKKPLLHAALEAVGHDDRAIKALVAMEAKGGPDYGVLDALITGVPTADAGRLRQARLEADAQGPDLERVGIAVDRLRRAVADAEDLRGSAAADAHSRAELLQAALAHSDRHADDTACPVCGAQQVLDQEWARRAEAEITALLQEAEAVRKAQTDVRDAMRTLQDLVHMPAEVPAVLAEPWREWGACRRLADPADLADRALRAAVTLTDACDTVARAAREELAAMDERWREAAGLLAEWTRLSREADAVTSLKKDVNAAHTWIKKLTTEIRDLRLDAFAGHTQRIWEKLRQQSSVDLKDVKLHGTEKATVRKLIMDVTVDDTEAPALGVMSQGELHSLALALFLPRVAAADSPFGFVVIDDPVQSMDPAKVDGLAQVLDELGRERQVVVFTHDTRLPRAFRSQGLPVTVLRVERGEKSRVRVVSDRDPVKEAIGEAMALAKTDDCPETALRHVLPALCRETLAAAFVEAAWLRRNRTGRSAERLQATLDATERLLPLAGLALFDDGDDRDDEEVRDRLRTLYGRESTTLIHQCQQGAHPGGFLPDDPVSFVRRVEALADRIRKPEVHV
ncbi:AAA family ATPase [Streptomyces mexicanus]|uniref:Nuclease SbcCD subunit C n=1 Tax=Streptomyces mexicanus TaxID=178566 RepID=A0A7X1LT82_9ACTN|nr:AAA family ATPase [Streptomyces mexicanus]MBC2868883.1 AAA family ATPase [Streptomyces mexicanus]